MTAGLIPRLRAELIRLIKSEEYRDRLFIKTVKFHTAPSKPNFTAWLAGSIYSATDVVLTKSITRENYLKSNQIPDWTNYYSEIRMYG